MGSSRVTLALEEGLTVLPASGETVVWGARADLDLSMLPENTTLISPFRPDHEAFTAAGWVVSSEPPKTAAFGVVFLPRAKSEARAMIAEAVRVVQGPIMIDGQKIDGIDGILRDLRKRGTLSTALSKAHGKLAVLSPGAAVSDWAVSGPTRTKDGFLTRPGIFSADGADPGSVLLANALPVKLGRRVADLGAGWGYLARAALDRDTVETVDLIEADLRALDCARANITDPRAGFHWADALTFKTVDRFDTVLMNPPFHKGHAGDPGLGQGFIQAAARLIRPGGQLWLVANRHLPYERILNAAFGEVKEVVGDRSYKLFRAARPAKQGVRP